MKNLMLALFVMIAMVFSDDIQAQATCTPAQKEACKKICGDNPTTCTPEQMEACKKICSGTSASTAVKVMNKAPEETANHQPACSKSNTTNANTPPVKLVGLELLPQEKAACTKPCAKKVQE